MSCVLLISNFCLNNDKPFQKRRLFFFNQIQNYLAINFDITTEKFALNSRISQALGTVKFHVKGISQLPKVFLSLSRQVKAASSNAKSVVLPLFADARDIIIKTDSLFSLPLCLRLLNICFVFWNSKSRALVKKNHFCVCKWSMEVPVTLIQLLSTTKITTFEFGCSMDA